MNPLKKLRGYPRIEIPEHNKPKYPLELYNEGRKLLCINNSSCKGFIKGKIYTSNGWYRDFIEYRVDIVIDSMGKNYNGWGVTNFKPVLSNTELILFGNKDDI